MCPKGDDPLTVNQNDRAISMRVQSLGSFDLEGVLGFQFMGANVPLSVSRTQTDQGCTEALAFKGKFGHVTCDFTRINRLTVQFDITFHSWPTFPNTNNLYSHGGNPSRFDFYCDLSDVTAFTTCEFTDIQATNIKGGCTMKLRDLIRKIVVVAVCVDEMPCIVQIPSCVIFIKYSDRYFHNQSYNMILTYFYLWFWWNFSCLFRLPPPLPLPSLLCYPLRILIIPQSMHIAQTVDRVIS